MRLTRRKEWHCTLLPWLNPSTVCWNPGWNVGTLWAAFFFSEVPPQWSQCCLPPWGVLCAVGSKFVRPHEDWAGRWHFCWTVPGRKEEEVLQREERSWAREYSSISKTQGEEVPTLKTEKTNWGTCSLVKSVASYTLCPSLKSCEPSNARTEFCPAAVLVLRPSHFSPVGPPSPFDSGPLSGIDLSLLWSMVFLLVNFYL